MRHLSSFWAPLIAISLLTAYQLPSGQAFFGIGLDANRRANPRGYWVIIAMYFFVLLVMVWAGLRNHWF
jgi:hypothetical protein